MDGNRDAQRAAKAMEQILQDQLNRPRLRPGTDEVTAHPEVILPLTEAPGSETPKPEPVNSSDR